MENNQITKKRKVFTIEEKVEIINKYNTGHTNGDLAREYKVRSSTISTIIRKRKEKILSDYESLTNPMAKRMKPCHYYEIDKATAEWFRESESLNDITISGAKLKKQALIFADFFQEPNFRASNGWLQRFKSRYDIRFPRNLTRTNNK